MSKPYDLYVVKFVFWSEFTSVLMGSRIMTNIAGIASSIRAPSSDRFCNLKFFHRSKRSWEFFWDTFNFFVSSSRFLRSIVSRKRRTSKNKIKLVSSVSILWIKKRKIEQFYQTKNLYFNICKLYIQAVDTFFCLELQLDLIFVISRRKFFFMV